VREQILFRFCQFGRDAAGFLFRHQSGYQFSSRSSESTIALDLRTPESRTFDSA
jgi:hypothetical protein